MVAPSDAAEHDALEKSSQRRRFVTQLERPRVFGCLVALHLLAACGGFAPAVYVYLQQGRWYLNPVTQPDVWGHDNHPTMKLHAVMSLLWIALSLVQYLVTPAFMLRRRSDGETTKKKKVFEKKGSSASAFRWQRDCRGVAALSHRIIGYAGACLLLAFAANANYLALVNGVSGKIHYNLLALITSSMMMWHLVRAIVAIRNKHDRYEHIRQVCGLLSWTCFPGVIRGLGLLPPQRFFLAEDCDVTSTSGAMALTFPFCIAGLAALRWAAIGEHYRHGDYAVFYLLIAADIALGLVDGTLYRCNPDGAWLEQMPGQAWTLKNW